MLDLARKAIIRGAYSPETIAEIFELPLSDIEVLEREVSQDTREQRQSQKNQYLHPAAEIPFCPRIVQDNSEFPYYIMDIRGLVTVRIRRQIFSGGPV